MKSIKQIVSSATLAIALSSSVMAGDISGGFATATSGDISGGKVAVSGDISGGRASVAGDISGGLVQLAIALWNATR